MRPLVQVRRATPFDAGRLARSPLFWPLADAVRRLAPLDGFPELEQLGRVFAGDAPVRFVAAAPRRPRVRAPLDAAELYDGRIALEASVPTRAGCWHDLMNALVWGTFPRAKAALHARQHRAVAARVKPGDRRLPERRTRELDALALLDEGGVLLCTRDAARVEATRGEPPEALAALAARGEVRVVVFGHAIFESLALGVAPTAVAAVVLEASADGEGALDAVDLALARVVDDPRRLTGPGEMWRVDLR